MKKQRFLLLLIAACIAAGFSIVTNPVWGLILAGGMIFAGLMELGPVVLIGMAVAAACLSRVLQQEGVPRLVNFLHFVLVAEAFVVALMQRDAPSQFGRNLARFIAGLFGVSFLSWALNGGEIVRPVMFGLVLSEPFLALFALIQARPRTATVARLWLLLAGIAAIQIPFAVYQFVAVAGGNPDLVQGTFIGQGAGAHVLGGTCLVAVLFCAARVLTSRDIHRGWVVTAAVAFSAVTLLADAKQVIVCFIPAVLYLVGELRRGSLTKLVIPLSAVAVLFACAYSVYEPLQRLSDTSSMEEGMQGKIAGLKVLGGYMSRNPGGWLLGLGPGNSVSRIALMPVQEPVEILSMKAAPATIDMLDASTHNYLWASSSVWSTISSWVGIAGDIGFLGLGVYISGIFLTWRELRRSPGWQSAAAASSLVMAGFLAFFYSWLEEPGFMLLIFSAAGLSIAASRPNPGPQPGFRNTGAAAEAGLSSERPAAVWAN